MKIFNYESDTHYRHEQETANIKKLKKIWVQENTIEKIFNDFGKNCSAVICHGTRNGAEQNFFKKYYPNADIIGTEISKTAGLFANTIQWDFRKQNKDWLEKFDILYSNSFDHTNIPEETLKVWHEQVKKSGCIYIEFCFDSDNNNSRASDPLEISEKDLMDLFEKSKLRVIKTYDTHGPNLNDKSKMYALLKY